MAPLLTTGARIAKGFDFLGYSFEPKGLSIAPKTLANFIDRNQEVRCTFPWLALFYGE
jgi:hypothetical protein